MLRNGLLISVFVIASILTAGCIEMGGEKDDENTIVLYGFSVMGEVFNEKIIPAFKEHTSGMGSDVKFITNYAGSGKITSQVLNGASAEIMILSTEWDAIELRNGGKIDTDWSSFPFNGTINTSPWIIMTRGGNPKDIADFDDLTGNVKLIHADPLTSGGARWSIFSIYGSELRKTEKAGGGPDEELAEELIRDVAGNVISWQSSARNALSQFTLGYGDALITYENDALLCREKGEDIEIIYPESTILSEHKVVIIDENVATEERELIENFMEFLFTEEVQSYFVEYHFRSVMENLNTDYPKIDDPFTVEYLGGWETAMEEIIEGIYEDIREG
jgi:ABC-type sulfate transport system substrate-binding protein